MFSIDDQKGVFLELRGKKYHFSDESEYRSLVIMLTDPNSERRKIKSEELSIAEDIGECKAKCEQYAAFISEFEDQRENLLSDSL